MPVVMNKPPPFVSSKVRVAPLAWGTVAGIALGVTYALSPVSVWIFIAIAGLLVWVGRSLTGRERRWVLGILTTGVVLRVLMIAVLFLGSEAADCGWAAPITDLHPAGRISLPNDGNIDAYTDQRAIDIEAYSEWDQFSDYAWPPCSSLTIGNDHFVTFFWDGDGRALKRRAASIQNIWLGNSVDPFLRSVAWEPYAWTSYLYVLAYIQYWLGSAPYAIHLVNVAAFLASTLLLYRLVRSAYGRAAALVGLALLVFLPTPFAWSVSVMKESVYILLGAFGVVATVAMLRANRFIKRIVALFLFIGTMPVVETVRVGGGLILGTGLGFGVAGGIIARRVSLVLLAFLLVPYAGYRVLGNADVQDRIMSRLRTFASVHLGHVRTTGNSYKLLDQRFYSSLAATGFDRAGRSNTVNSIETMTPAEALRFSGRALGYFVVAPLPWQVQSRTEMVFLAQQAVWYLMVVLAAIGVVAGLRRDPLVTCLLCGVTVAGSVAIALNSGNIGTMVRHRDTVVPFVVWLSALGAVTTASNWMSWATPGTLDSE
jgi:hypothetical protein